MKPTMRLEGVRDLSKTLNNMPANVAKRISRKVLMKLLQPIADRARQLARVEDPNVQKPSAGHLRDTIGVGQKLSRRQKRLNRPLAPLEVYVGPGIIGKGQNAARHAHLIEFGTEERRHASGKSTGAMPRRPFMRPAWDALHGKVFTDLAKLLRDELAAYAKRQAAKARRR